MIRPAAVAILLTLCVAAVTTQELTATGSTAAVDVARCAVGSQDQELTLSPKSCRRCHPFIYARWRRGMHRYSFEDPIFQQAYAQAYLESAGKAAKVCLQCHAPLAHIKGDLTVSNPDHRMGVQCNFCHSVQAVDLDRPLDRWTLAISDVKASPHAKTRPREHGTFHQPLLKSSKLCAGCHEFVVEGGAHIVSTWTEWLDSPYAKEGKTCQSCHMPSLKKVVRRDGSTLQLNDHDLSGGHSSEQVRKAARVEIVEVERRGSELNALVAVENIGSGHCFPTGMPSRTVVLTAELLLGQTVVDQDTRVFRKVIGDASGRELKSDAAIKMRGRRILSDNRLRPREKRLIRFRFHVSSQRAYNVRTSLSYRYSPVLATPQDIRIKVSQTQRHIPIGE